MQIQIAGAPPRIGCSARRGPAPADRKCHPPLQHPPQLAGAPPCIACSSASRLLQPLAPSAASDAWRGYEHVVHARQRFECVMNSAQP